MSPDACRKESHASARRGVHGSSLLAEIALLSSVAALPASRARVLVAVDLRSASRGCVPVEAEVRLRLLFENDLSADLPRSGLLGAIPEVGAYASVLAAAKPLAEDADRGCRIGVSAKNPVFAIGRVAPSDPAPSAGRAVPACAGQSRTGEVPARRARDSTRLNRLLNVGTAK